MPLKKKIVVGLLALPIVVGGAAFGRFYVAAPKARVAEDLEAPSDSATVERGRYLANHVYACMACHSEVREDVPGEPLVDGRLGSGRAFPPDAYGAGTLRAPNLTPAHLGDWTDGEIVRAIREGVDKDGEPLFPMMPYATYGRVMPKADALAIVAYLRTLPPIDHDPGRSEIAFPVSMFVRTVPAPVEREPEPPPAEGLERGRFLLEAMSCGDCHHTVDERRQPVEGMAFAGGVKFPTAVGMLQTPNITSHESTGLGQSSPEEIARAVFEGKARDGRDLYIMPWRWYAGLSEADRKALVAAVREILAVDHEVARIAPTAPPPGG
ncbi:MAG: hypothetical protein D6705_12575 [Deltaproteobacteria bacterium]|nr:MAG: hypothetical protein D6705_12575 [Deltaproteobacteria bacterium]